MLLYIYKRIIGPLVNYPICISVQWIVHYLPGFKSVPIIKMFIFSRSVTVYLVKRNFGTVRLTDFADY